MNGAWPPSSTETRCSDDAAFPASIFPTAVDPVNVSFFTRRSLVKTSPIGAGSLAVTMFMTPAGTPASARISKIALAHNGVASAGFRTMVHPAAKAGPILRVSIDIG